MQITTIQNTVCGLIAAACVGVGTNHAQGASFSFGPDVIDGGSVSATMDIVLDGTTLTATIDNTSATSLEDGFFNSGGDTDHAPGIVGFGFNVDPDELALASWTLKAIDKDDNMVTVGSDAGASGESWSMGTFTAGVTLDFLPDTDKGIKGALYNPAAVASVALAAAPNYFTTAVLEMHFAADPSEPMEGFMPFLRMQNIGVNGEGSSKQWGSDGGTTGGTDGGTDGSTTDPSLTPVPEPITGALSIVALGAVACAASRRR